MESKASWEEEFDKMFFNLSGVSPTLNAFRWSLKQVVRSVVKSVVAEALGEVMVEKRSLAYRSDWPNVMNEIAGQADMGFNSAVDTFEAKKQEVAKRYV